MMQVSNIATPYQLTLNFYDLKATIRSDSESCLQRFGQMYHRFQTNGQLRPRQRAIDFAILTGSSTQGQPALVLDGEVWPLGQSGLSNGRDVETILNMMLAGVRSHLLIHAGVVAFNNQGTIIVADSFHGKTTLVLELVRRGFKFLSDETAALGRVDGLVHPYPRKLSVRSGTLNLTGFLEAAAQAQPWFNKMVLDIEQIQPHSLGRAVPIKNIIVLQDATAQPREKAANSERQLDILMSRVDENFVDAVGSIEGVTELKVATHSSFPQLTLRAFGRTQVFTQIETLAQERDILILDVIEGPRHRPSFDQPARLDQLSTSQAGLELLRRFLGGSRSALIKEDFDGNATRLFVELSLLINQADCYALSVGPLQDMADLICNVADAAEK